MYSENMTPLTGAELFSDKPTTNKIFEQTKHVKQNLKEN